MNKNDEEAEFKGSRELQKKVQVETRENILAVLTLL